MTCDLATFSVTSRIDLVKVDWPRDMFRGLHLSVNTLLGGCSRLPYPKKVKALKLIIDRYINLIEDWVTNKKSILLHFSKDIVAAKTNKK